METIEKQILSAIYSGNLLTYLHSASMHNRHERMLYVETIVNLHNQGKLDAIVEFEKAKRLDDSYDFFMIKHIFEELLPLIEASVPSVIACVQHLLFESGDDMSAGMLVSSFVKYCESKLDRPKEVLSIALMNYDKKLDFITPALIAGSNIELVEFLEKAIQLTQHENIHIRTKSIYALGNIKYQEKSELITQAFEAISRTVANTSMDCLTLATAIRSIYSLFVMNNSMLEEVIYLMRKIMEEKDDQVIYVLSEILWFNHGEMPLIMIELFLKELTNVNPEHTGTIDNIDHALSDLLKKGHTTQVIDFIEKVLINNSQLSIKQFDSFIREISQNNALMNSLITRWFLSKRIRFGRCASDLIRAHGGDDYILSVDSAQIRQQVGIYYFLAKKACGWFFINPISAASFMISLIDSASEAEVQAIGELLFNPLLISYSGDLREYIDEVSIKSSAKIQKVLSELLVNVETYHNDLQSISTIAELRPSQTQRETYYRHHSELMNESFKKAPKGFFSQLFKPTVLLYGNRSIHYIHHGMNGEKTRQEVPLQSISHSIELPSLDYLNPHGLDEMLRSFKLEGCTS